MKAGGRQGLARLCEAVYKRSIRAWTAGAGLPQLLRACRAAQHLDVLQRNQRGTARLEQRVGLPQGSTAAFVFSVGFVRSNWPRCRDYLSGGRDTRPNGVIHGERTDTHQQTEPLEG